MLLFVTSVNTCKRYTKLASSCALPCHCQNMPNREQVTDIAKAAGLFIAFMLIWLETRIEMRTQMKKT